MSAPQLGQDIRLADIIGSKIITTHGNVIGHVIDLRVTVEHGYQVDALVYDPAGWLERLRLQAATHGMFGAHHRPKLIDWRHVAHIARGEIVLKPSYRTPIIRRNERQGVHIARAITHC